MTVDSKSILIFPKNVEYTNMKICEVSAKVTITINKSYNFIVLLLIFQ